MLPLRNRLDKIALQRGKIGYSSMGFEAILLSTARSPVTRSFCPEIEKKLERGAQRLICARNVISLGMKTCVEEFD